ncbi:bifunctional endoribonuclease/protein kinase ire1 [Elasticomyces elasticus]|nr:bifunctional endoribonuclease/protein kinase ire1 [Elasticomyces elasticus]
MPRRRPPGTPNALGLRETLLLLLVLPFLATAVQQQQPPQKIRLRSQQSPPEGHSGLSGAQVERPQIRTTHQGNGRDTVINPTNERALATYAPAESAVRAPPAKPSVPTGGLSRQSARNLQDWEVEDIILLATVDGKIHAVDRNTGVGRWRLESAQPMVETVYHRQNRSGAQLDGSQEEEFLWIVEPSQDGSLYIYAPGPKLGMQKLGLTVRQLAELGPYAGEDPPMVYTAEKRNTIYTIDAATGKILKLFSAAGSINQEESVCKQSTTPGALRDAHECRSAGTLTLGRTEYIIGIQNSVTGDEICTIKYFEWSPNNRDRDLHAQYATTLDNKYVYSKFDGSVLALDHTSKRKYDPAYLFGQFSSPVVRVYDIVKPFDDLSSDPALVVLPQPVGPVPAVDHAFRFESVFVNCTESGSWYAMSEDKYPNVTIGASQAICYNEKRYAHGLSSATQRSKLVGVHPLSPLSLESSGLPTISGPEEHLALNPPEEALAADELEVMRIGPPSTKRFQEHSWYLLILFATSLAAFGLFRDNQMVRSYTGLWEKQFSGVARFLNGFQTAPQGSTILHEPLPKVESTLEPSGVDPVPQQSDEATIVVFEQAEETRFPNPTGEEPVLIEQSVETTQDAFSTSPGDMQQPEKKTGAHRGRRGGKKHREQKMQNDAKRRQSVKGNELTGTALLTPPATPENMGMTGKIRINNLEVDLNRVLGEGNDGTTVYEGSFEGREVAVKRMLSRQYELADSEVKNYQKSDNHPNVIRYYCKEMDRDFLYIAVELCYGSLWDAYCSAASADWRRHQLKDTVEEQSRRQQLDKLAIAISQDVPSALKQLAEGLQALHSLRMIHRDIKPQNILIGPPRLNGPDPRLVLADFGLCKILQGDQSTYRGTAMNAGTCGWKAPEVIARGGDAEARRSTSSHGSAQRQDSQSSESAGATPQGVKRAADIFSLGCVYFFVLTGGLHPFDEIEGDEIGMGYYRDINISKNKPPNLFKLDLGADTVEPRHLIGWMLQHRPEERPTALQVRQHPFFWEAKERLNFLCDVSDHFEREPREPPSMDLEALEAAAFDILGTDFLARLDRKFVDTLGRQRKYTGSRLLDLLRALRNKRNHYEDMPEDVKRRVGGLPDGYLNYWTSRFPKLLLGCHDVVLECGLEKTDRFQSYFRST